MTLPTTTGLPTGWSMGFATDSAKPLSVQVNAHIGRAHRLARFGFVGERLLALANTSQGAYEFLVLQYDGSGNFRVVDATPATAQAIGMIGASGISHWSFPAVSAYAATVADNGNVVSSFNSPLSYMAVTLPSTTAIPMGWTIGIATDSGKSASVQVNGTSGGHILFPGSGAAATSASLASGNYELLVLQFDGSNFRIVEATPATATQIGIAGNVTGINRWNFPAVGTYAASQADNGNALSSYNTPTASLIVTLPSTTSIGIGWIMGFATDNGKTMTVQVNGGAGEKILVPAGGGTSSNSITLGGRPELRICGAAIRRLELPRGRSDTADAQQSGRADQLGFAGLFVGLHDQPDDARQRLPLHLHRAKHLEARAHHGRILMMAAALCARGAE